MLGNLSLTAAAVRLNLANHTVTHIHTRAYTQAKSYLNIDCIKNLNFLRNLYTRNSFSKKDLRNHFFGTTNVYTLETNLIFVDSTLLQRATAPSSEYRSEQSGDFSRTTAHK
jgi:hypothetical protein